jgi:hypothetical protein
MALYRKKEKPTKIIKERFDILISSYFSHVQVKPPKIRINQWEKWPDGIMTFVLKQRFPVAKADIDLGKLIRKNYKYYNIQHQRIKESKMGQKFSDSNSTYICFRLYETNFGGNYKCEFQILPITNHVYYLIYDKLIVKKIRKYIEEMRTAISENDLITFIKGFKDVVEYTEIYDYCD